jgi:hypothetical protein
VTTIDGLQAVNGRIVESVIELPARSCTVCNAPDPAVIAQRAFRAGRVAARLGAHADAPVEFIDDVAVIRLAATPSARRPSAPGLGACG